MKKTTDSRSRVFDRLFRVLDERQTENKFKAYAWYIYYKDQKGKIYKSIELGRNKDDALKDFNYHHPFKKGEITIIKAELAPKTLKPIQSTLRQNKKMEQIRNKIGDSKNSKKIFNISAHLKGGEKVRKFVAIGTSESEVKNKVKRLFLTRGEYEFIISENPTFSMERFNKLAKGKEVIRNELN